MYLLVNFTQNKKNTLMVFLLNKENKFTAYLELLKPDNQNDYVHFVSITSEPTFIIGREKTNASSELFYTRNGFAYNNLLISTLPSHTPYHFYELWLNAGVYRIFGILSQNSLVFVTTSLLIFSFYLCIMAFWEYFGEINWYKVFFSILLLG